ncbi:hypothetical protein K466DRAFT_569816 [Polyporus arcularius HHB13444]|uniref:Uncharacterized protein n=1 Tax=Polyporus arcularius HHB13444 TaxID=1314778 RepID=A0A5C3NUB3_9APHY|nr:hypothetical protein K466DRAFT_569816 [Polyporus arcularius HHB13444]
MQLSCKPPAQASDHCTGYEHGRSHSTGISGITMSVLSTTRLTTTTSTRLARNRSAHPYYHDDMLDSTRRCGYCRQRLSVAANSHPTGLTAHIPVSHESESAGSDPLNVLLDQLEHGTRHLNSIYAAAVLQTAEATVSSSRAQAASGRLDDLASLEAIAGPSLKAMPELALGSKVIPEFHRFCVRELRCSTTGPARSARCTQPIKMAEQASAASGLFTVTVQRNQHVQMPGRTRNVLRVGDRSSDFRIAEYSMAYTRVCATLKQYWADAGLPMYRLVRRAVPSCRSRSLPTPLDASRPKPTTLSAHEQSPLSPTTCARSNSQQTRDIGAQSRRHAARGSVHEFLLPGGRSWLAPRPGGTEHTPPLRLRVCSVSPWLYLVASYVCLNRSRAATTAPLARRAGRSASVMFELSRTSSEVGPSVESVRAVDSDAGTELRGAEHSRYDRHPRSAARVSSPGCANIVSEKETARRENAPSSRYGGTSPSPQPAARRARLRFHVPSRTAPSADTRDTLSQYQTPHLSRRGGPAVPGSQVESAAVSHSTQQHADVVRSDPETAGGACLRGAWRRAQGATAEVAMEAVFSTASERPEGRRIRCGRAPVSWERRIRQNAATDGGDTAGASTYRAPAASQLAVMTRF